MDLGRLTEKERQRAFAMFGPDKSMQLYDRGIRRRMAPMLNGDRRRLAMANSLLFTLPGTPVLRYGEEIGMGDDLDLPERYSIRTPMQWSAEQNAGFSKAPRKQLVRPVISGGEFGFEQVNVDVERGNPTSLLNQIALMIRTRIEHPEFGWGRWCLVDTGQAPVLALHNFAGQMSAIQVALPDSEATRHVDLLDGTSYAVERDGSCRAKLDGYGFCWLRVADRAA